MSADFTPEKEDYKILTPFKMQVLTNFPYIEADFDALTNYGLLCKVVEYLNNVITNENEVTEQVTSLYNAYVSLQAYVNQEIGDFETTVTNRVDGLESYMNNYFNNLDVQQEINNKLDAMAADGTLTNLIKDYVDPIYQAYETEINNTVTEQNTAISNLTTQVGTINNKVDSATSGTPKGVYETLAALEAADPDHDYIYVVSADGKWYYYNTSLTSWTAGGTYQGTAIPDNEMSRINKVYSEVINTSITDLSTNEHGFYYTSNNEWHASDSYRTSDYIICQGYNKITYKTGMGASGYEILYFDRSKNLLDSVSIAGDNTDTEKTVTVPSAAYYVRMSANSGNYATAYINLYLENSEINNLLNNINNTNDNTDRIDKIENIQETTKQDDIYIMKDVTDATSHYYIRSTDNKIVNSENARTSDFINIKGYKIIRFLTVMSSPGYSLLMYNANKEIINASSVIGGDGTEQIVEIPNTAKYIRLSCYNSANWSNAYIKAYNPSYNFKTCLMNKNILILGDSITTSTDVTVDASDLETTAYSWPDNPSRKRYPWLFNKYYYPKEIRCYALSGATYSKRIDQENPRASMINQALISINDKTNPNNVFNQATFNPDIIILAAGTNQGTIGSYTTAMSKTVYESDNHTIDVDATLAALDQTIEIEAARYTLMKLKNEWPMAQMYVVLPIQRMSRDQITNAMNIELEKLAIRYGAIVINGCDNGITQEGNVYDGEGTTLIDGLHPNQNGQYLMTRQILKSIESNYLDYSIFS